VVPGKKPTGTNTATSTSEVAITAPVTSPMASEVAAWALMCSSPMWRLMFSITTIASSTTSPVARVMPKRVRVLIENPMSFTKKNVPTRETGIVTAGMSVLRQSWRNRNMVSTTKTMAMSSVNTTSQMDSLTTVVVSKAIPYRSPGGKRFDRRSSSARTPRSTSMELAWESCITPMPMASCPRKRRVEP
jgi:hypothetical protein